jgi:hypothetical protein
VASVKQRSSDGDELDIDSRVSILFGARQALTQNRAKTINANDAFFGEARKAA